MENPWKFIMSDLTPCNYSLNKTLMMTQQAYS